MPFLHNTQDYFDDNATMLIQMDLHHWNLMVKPEQQGYRLSGVLDFGDSIIGRSKLLELATPIIFLCQGDARLVSVLLKSYKLLEPMTPTEFQRKLMAVVLLRPDCDLNFVLQQVPITGARDTWDQIAQQLFPI
ncbi:MAG: hygromycin-B 7''-O-kinase [Granulosicoccus sp.]|jgi:hygromycin-B 7''-O-kinase